MSVFEVSDSSFNQEVIQSTIPVLVDFWAPWCGPCRMIAEVIDEIAADYGSILRVVKVNTDQNPTIATEYGIRSIPTIIIFVAGQRVDTVIGAVPKSTLKTKLDQYI
uniref:Thioredoxin n=1 Tax=Crouania attenuata TaxID=42002 RepID=A0A4D6WQP3_9FLOR|nr:Thioredoxin [Crouania attenuata]